MTLPRHAASCTPSLQFCNHIPVGPRRIVLRKPSYAPITTPEGSGHSLKWITRTATVSTPIITSTPNTPPATASTTKFQTQDDSQSDKFDWYRTWYPVAAMSALKPDKPNAVQLLGMNLVVWKDKQGTWRCFEDLCPHRLAPLSEGRIHESGQLQCTYHGWLFNETGACTSIPQIADQKAHATACSSNRGCVKAYPAQVLQDMLWVFADSSPAGWTQAMSTAAGRPSSCAEELTQKGWTLKAPWFQRDIPLSFDVFLENLTDPAHVPQSHHGVVGDRNADQQMTIKLGADGVSKTGFEAFVESPAMSYKIEYLPPSLVKYHFPGAYMLLYGTPTAKGWSRIVMSFIGPKSSNRTRPPTPALPPLLNWFIDNVLEKVPALQHAFNRNPIVDGDSYFMHYAERVLYDRGDHSSWSRQYYMPATADVAVMAWRKWIDKFGSNLPTLPQSAADLPPLLPREQVFDRYNQHTKHCPHCSAALRNTEIAAAVAAVIGSVAAGAAVVSAVQSLMGGAAAVGGGFAAGAVGFAVAAAAVVAGLLKLRRLFIFEDYVHADQH